MLHVCAKYLIATVNTWHEQTATTKELASRQLLTLGFTLRSPPWPVRAAHFKRDMTYKTVHFKAVNTPPRPASALGHI